MGAVIKVENLSKQYRLGSVGTGSFAHDLNRGWHRIRGKEDPYVNLGEENDRTLKGQSQYVWALKDVNFKVEHGDVVGVIGRNGAGKSTLLKILSRTTSPTKGSVKIKGRIASLLEVGTGFHPELSGRENIFLNGAILGMNRHEIREKFDEIVAFAGIERYIDTPVKRYSSGMYVRLAFAVAAHLEPEILIIDEVLAVGDAEFQKKALGKMKDASQREGRTVLFVSHNMKAIKNLCQSIIYMSNGSVVRSGPTEEMINFYLAQTNKDSGLLKKFATPGEALGNEQVRLKRIEVCPVKNKPSDLITIHTTLQIEIEFWNSVTDREVNLSLVLNTLLDECVFSVATPAGILNAGLHKATCEIPGNLLNDGIYKISVMVVGERSYSIFYFEDMVSFEVSENRAATGWHGNWIGMVRPNLAFTIH